MKYRVFDVDNKAEYTKEMSFDELKDFLNQTLKYLVKQCMTNGKMLTMSMT